MTGTLAVISVLLRSTSESWGMPRPLLRFLQNTGVFVSLWLRGLALAELTPCWWVEVSFHVEDSEPQSFSCEIQHPLSPNPSPGSA